MAVKTYFHTGFLATMLMASASAFAITPFQATYQFSYNGKNISTATRELKQQGDQRWIYTFNAKAGFIASASETSEFHVNKDQVISDRFNRATNYIGISDSLKINYDHNSNMVSTNKSGKARSFKLENNPLDELNAEIQIREDLKKNQLKSVYYITDAKGIDARKFVKLGEETVKTPYGNIKSLKFKLEHGKPERNTLFWLAPQLDYLPVKVAHNDGGSSYAISLIQYK
ncbi:DUF3108 domain-containing protein [Acinetobacter apis]|uniref:DUF3108 domain-containing protein n=1 Tax=Acinetobacter apis TaxID=1229165 RepID=A0A217EGR2_9GAMM|nr:DUF3108 domain-containing protein [Acinetobacter apis]SNQ29366.1 Protein of unknown function [Acinetobacter apis]